MSKKRTKQYLMLLMVIGLVSIAAGGSGTFASFQAETTNAGNYFATGSLFLHNTHGATTCTSESNSGNINPGTGVNGDQCATLFTVNLTDMTPHYAQLTLQNAGSVNAGDIKFALAQACGNARFYEDRGVTLTSDYTHGGTTLDLSSLPVALRSGQHVELSNGTTTDEVVIASAAAPTSSPTSITLTAGTASNDYVTGDSVDFTADLGTGNVCNALKFVVDETTSSFLHGVGDGASCAYPALADANDGSGCDFADSHVQHLSDIGLYPTLDPLTLKTGGGDNNTGSLLSANGTRYFLIGVEPDVDFGNTYQDRQATFDLVWHIDQA